LAQRVRSGAERGLREDRGCMIVQNEDTWVKMREEEEE